MEDKKTNFLDSNFGVSLIILSVLILIIGLCKLGTRVDTELFIKALFGLLIVIIGGLSFSKNDDPGYRLVKILFTLCGLVLLFLFVIQLSWGITIRDILNSIF